eukprot:1375107-Prymnesium_polylepis.1
MLLWTPVRLNCGSVACGAVANGVGTSGGGGGAGMARHQGLSAQVCAQSDEGRGHGCWIGD